MWVRWWTEVEQREPLDETRPPQIMDLGVAGRLQRTQCWGLQVRHTVYLSAVIFSETNRRRAISSEEQVKIE